MLVNISSFFATIAFVTTSNKDQHIAPLIKNTTPIAKVVFQKKSITHIDADNHTDIIVNLIN